MKETRNLIPADTCWIWSKYRLLVMCVTFDSTLGVMRARFCRELVVAARLVVIALSEGSLFRGQESFLCSRIVH